MHVKRWITAIVLIPALIYIIGYSNPLIFHFLLVITASVSIWEFYNITGNHHNWEFLVIDFPLIGIFFLVGYTRQALLILPVFLLWFLAHSLIEIIGRSEPTEKKTYRISTATLAFIYVCIPLSMLSLIYIYPSGRMWVFFILLVVFASDTGAFYGGRFFGRTRLHHISPKKTVEGAIGGFLCGFIAGVYFIKIVKITPLDIWLGIVIALICIFAQIGDLIESMIKRNHQVKDSGFILPGHGGVLDRIDGLLLSIPVLYVYIYLK